MTNPLAEIVDVFFNGRPAKTDKPSGIRVLLRPKQIEQLKAGRSLIFTASGIKIEILSAKK